MQKLSIPYRSELIAVLMVVVIFITVKNRFQYVQTAAAAIEASKQVIDQRKGLAGRWQSAERDFAEAMGGFLVNGPSDCKNIVQDKAWSNNINLIDVRSGQDMSGILGMGSLDLTINGNYKDIVKFVREIEENKLRIMAFSITGVDKHKNVSMKVYCYFTKGGEHG